MNRHFSLQAIGSVAYKEFLHIVRDWRVLILLVMLPPFFTLVFGHAFEVTDRTDAPALLSDSDHTERSQRFVEALRANKTFRWRLHSAPAAGREPDLLGNSAQAALVIPAGWGTSLANGDPLPLMLYLDGSDTNTATELEGGVQESLGDFQLKERQEMIDTLPDEVFELARKMPPAVEKRFVSSMSPWGVTNKVLYNPKQRFIDFVVPGIIGLILQLLTVTLTACTIAREREAGTLYQLMVTSLHRSEIVIGKMLPYLAISVILILVIIGMAAWHFQVQFHAPAALAAICLLFLLCSLGLGLLISAVSQTQTQAIQLSVFFLLPVFILSGAFAPLDQLPQGVQYLSECFPLTHFCRAFRLVNLYRAPAGYLVSDLAVMSAGAAVTFAGAAFLLRRVQD